MYIYIHAPVFPREIETELAEAKAQISTLLEDARAGGVTPRGSEAANTKSETIHRLSLIGKRASAKGGTDAVPEENTGRGENTGADPIVLYTY